MKCICCGKPILSISQTTLAVRVAGVIAYCHLRCAWQLGVGAQILEFVRQCWGPPW